MAKPPKTPQTKKALSYALDRRNAYGENSKASRRLIPFRKACENRKDRRKTDQALSGVERADEETAALIESTARQAVERVGGWRKVPDASLGEHVAARLTRRARHDGDAGA